MNRLIPGIAVLLSMLMVLSFFAGCGKKNSKTSTGTSEPKSQLSDDSPYIGSWEGTLKAGGTSLLLRIFIDRNAVQIDVPAQGVKAIPASSFRVDGKKLTVEFASFKASMEAESGVDGTLEAKWMQGGASYPLVFSRVDEEALKGAAARNAELASRGERVKFKSADASIELAGTFRIPDGQGPFPCLVLISGSGPQDRDETINELRPFRDLAEFLAARGWATLRYDDRGVGESGGSFAGSTSSDFSLDAIGAYRFVAADKRMDSRRIALAGHSEGGYVAMLAENSLEGVYALVLLAAPGVGGYDILLDQSADLLTAMGAGKAAVAAAASANKTIYDLILSSTDFPLEAVKDTLKKAGVPDDQLASQLPGLSDPWFRHFLQTDPSKPLSALRSPVLALNGTKDLQVRADKNLEAIKVHATNSGKEVRIVSLEGLNHLFQEAITGLPEEYASLSADFNERVMETIAEWLEELPH
jgi:pimeloyl-ACP methyl ester carboxylesterase